MFFGESFTLIVGSDSLNALPWVGLDMPRPLVCGMKRYSVLLGVHDHKQVGMVALIDQESWELLSLEALCAAADREDYKQEIAVGARNWVCLLNPRAGWFL